MGVDLSRAAFVHPSALIYGDVVVAEGASIWCNVVIRSEAAQVRIGAYSNVQDFVMIHTDPGRPVAIGEHTSITHHSTVHGACIGDNCLIGINATVYGGAVVGDNSIVGQHGYVKDGTVVPANSIAVGSPARVIRQSNNWVANRMNALFYHRNALAYADGEHRAWEGPDFAAWMAAEMARLTAEFDGRNGR